MLIIFLAGILLSVAPAVAEEPSVETCQQCMGGAHLSKESCTDCAIFVHQTMLNSSVETLVYLMDSLKSTAYKNCAKLGVGSKACQVYYSLCDGDMSCDPELISKMVEYRELSISSDQLFA